MAGPLVLGWVRDIVVGGFVGVCCCYDFIRRLSQ